MRRKNRKWVAIAVGLYLAVMVSAYRWSVGNRLPGEDSLLIKIQREGVRRLAEEKAKEAAAQPKPTGESRLTAAGPAYVAARYDATHVVFMLAAETESRFSNSPLIRSSGTPTKVPAPSRPAAPLAGMQELWEPDPQALHFFPEIVQKTQPGDRWTLSLSPDSTIPVIVDRVVVAPMGCSLALGFLATVPPDQQSAFAASGREYFAVRRTAVELADPPVAAQIGEIPGWRASPAVAKRIEQQLNDRMKQEVTKIDARLIANAGSPGATAGQTLFDAHPHLKEWIHADQGLQRGEGALNYDLRAFLLTPDAAPRLFVRARWKLAGATVFLMSAWFKADAASAQAVLVSADSSWSASLREGNAGGALDDRLDFQTVLNEFDADHDGWAELLIHSYDVHSYDVHSYGSASTSITLYLYTDLGLVSMKTPLRRAAQPPESCLDP
jgi:hypothetical protein